MALSRFRGLKKLVSTFLYRKCSPHEGAGVDSDLASFPDSRLQLLDLFDQLSAPIES